MIYDVPLESPDVKFGWIAGKDDNITPTTKIRTPPDEVPSGDYRTNPGKNTISSVQFTNSWIILPGSSRNFRVLKVCGPGIDTCLN